jgi:tetratricopeptide (TPR) repeat protein/O-antigen ligase
VAFLLIGVAAAAWLAGALLAGRLEWRRTPLDLPVLLLLGLVAVQVAVGHRALVDWALGPARPVTELAAEFPAPFLTIGTVAPRRTVVALLIFAGYAAVYFLVTQTVRTRGQVGRLVRSLLVTGGLLAFLGLLDYLAGGTWLLRWREHPFVARLSGTFVNPDHFAAWLAMLVALGLGWMAARAAGGRRGPSLAQRLSVRELREQAARRYLPMIGVLVMVIALIFTLSRGGLVNLVAALLTLLGLLYAVRRARASLVATGVLLIAVVAYGGWIGFGPLMTRLSLASENTAHRLTQYAASLPLLREFPVLGVGLGGYREVYVRHQPVAHQPALVAYPYAHNDLLQLAIELGPLGVALCLFLGWRIASDLVGAHVLGRGACPVDGGEGPEAARSDRYSLGVAIGALAGVTGLVVHSGIDFSARIPAVGILAAALLGLATVALHTRLARGQEQLLSGTRTLSLARRRVALAVGALGLAVLAGWTWAWVHAGRVRAAEAALLAARGADAEARVAAVLALDPHSVLALVSRARALQAEAVRAWQSSPVPGLDRAAVARERLAQARADLRRALTAAPTNPWLHLDLAWVEATDAAVLEQAGSAALAAAMTHGARAVALGRDSPLFYAAMARLAYSVPELGLRAAREAVQRQPALLAEMVELYRPLGLTDTEWLALAPATGADRLALAGLLESRRLRADALAVYRAAASAAAPFEASVCRWALAEALGRAGAGGEAVQVLRAALAADAGNPELERALGVALAREDDPEALDRLRAAVAAMERRPAAGERRPFAGPDARLAALVTRLAPDLDRTTRYRRALATYLTERRLWDQALPEWRELVAEEPREAGARFGLGLAREGLGQTDEALEDFRAAVALEPRVPRYRQRLAERLWQGEQYFQAINEWRVLAEQLPRDVESRLALGRAFEKVAQPVDAYRQYRDVLALDPAQADAARALARLEGRRR